MHITQRIATKDVQPSIDFIEKITGLTYDEEDWLGTTGKKENADGKFENNSSGDLDLNTDASKISKAQLIKKLTVWLKSQGVDDAEMMNLGKVDNKRVNGVAVAKNDGWIKDAGDQVHFRTPIAGDARQWLCSNRLYVYRRSSTSTQCKAWRNRTVRRNRQSYPTISYCKRTRSKV